MKRKKLKGYGTVNQFACEPGRGMGDVLELME
jgi:hypothetical protein